MAKQTPLFGGSSKNPDKSSAKAPAKTGPVKVKGYHVPRKTITRAGYDVGGYERKRGGK